MAPVQHGSLVLFPTISLPLVTPRAGGDCTPPFPSLVVDDDTTLPLARFLTLTSKRQQREPSYLWDARPG